MGLRFILIFLCVHIFNKGNAQSYATPYYNIELQEQVTLNQGVRMISEAGFSIEYESQKKTYEKVVGTVTTIVVIKNLITEQLINANNILKNGMQIKNLYDMVADIFNSVIELGEAIVERPAEAVLFYELFIDLGTRCATLYVDIKEETEKEGQDYILDNYDRQYIIDRVTLDVYAIKSTINHIIIMLEATDNKKYWEKIPFVQEWISLDKALIQEMMWNYENLK